MRSLDTFSGGRHSDSLPRALKRSNRHAYLRIREVCAHIYASLFSANLSPISWVVDAMADKEATVYVLDLGKSMGRIRRGRTENDLEWAMRYVWDKITATVRSRDGWVYADLRSPWNARQPHWASLHFGQMVYHFWLSRKLRLRHGQRIGQPGRLW